MESLGIDLGTTFTCAFISNSNRDLKVLELSHGDRITRSAVQIANGKWNLVRLGDFPSKKRLHISLAKRLIGRSIDDGQLESELSDLHHAALSETIPVFEVGQEKILPEEVSAFILGRVRNEADAKADIKFTSCVLAVPAYFTHQQREATLDAAEIAGFNRQTVRLVPEPLAALVAHVESHFQEKGSTQDGYWFVIDIGGGTSDVTIAYIEKTDSRDSIVVKATAGDNALGGVHFDKELMDLVLQKAQSSDTGLDSDTPLSAYDKNRLRGACERAKEHLSQSMSSNITIQDTSGEDITNVDVSRDEAEKAWHKPIERIKQLFQDALRLSQTTAIENVLVAGGTGNMPCIRPIIEDVLPGATVHFSHLSEAVAQGAALIGANPKIAIADVAPRGIGIELQDGSLGMVLPPNEPLPAVVQEEFGVPSDYRQGVIIRLYEGEARQARDNILLGEFVITDIPPNRPGTLITVELNIEKLGDLAATAWINPQAAQDESVEELPTESLTIRYKPRHGQDKLKELGLLAHHRLDGKATISTGNTGSVGSLAEDRRPETKKRAGSDGWLATATTIPLKRSRYGAVDSDSE